MTTIDDDDAANTTTVGTVSTTTAAVEGGDGDDGNAANTTFPDGGAATSAGTAATIDDGDAANTTIPNNRLSRTDMVDLFLSSKCCITEETINLVCQTCNQQNGTLVAINCFNCAIGGGNLHCKLVSQVWKLL